MSTIITENGTENIINALCPACNEVHELQLSKSWFSYKREDEIECSCGVASPRKLWRKRASKMTPRLTQEYFEELLAKKEAMGYKVVHITPKRHYAIMTKFSRAVLGGPEFLTVFKISRYAPEPIIMTFDAKELSIINNAFNG